MNTSTKGCESGEPKTLSLEGTRLYIHLKNQSPRTTRNIEGMLIKRGAQLCSFLHEGVTHVLTDKVKDDFARKANRLPAYTRSMKMIEKSCKQNETINMLNCSGNVAAKRLGINTVMLADILGENDLHVARTRDPVSRTLVNDWLETIEKDLPY